MQLISAENIQEQVPEHLVNWIENDSSTLIAQPVKADVAKLEGLKAYIANGSQLPNEERSLDASDLKQGSY